MKHTSKILVVDDEPVSRQLLEAILYPENFDLYYAENGKEALEKALVLNPDLILMDVMMPEMDGFQVCRKLRNHEMLGNVPIILITALDDRDSMIKGLDSGADDYISKPFDRIEVLAKVKNITQLDRYKRILHKYRKPETYDKRTTKPDIILHYTGLIQKSLLPSPEFISKILPQHFIIISPPGIMSSTTLSILQKKDSTIIVLCYKKFQGISDVLMNILSITLINKIIYKRDSLNAAEILDDLRITMQSCAPFSEEGIPTVSDMNFALCIISKADLKMQYAGSNIPLFIISGKGSERIEPGYSEGNTKHQDNFNNIKINLAENDSFYILSNNVLEYFEEDYRKSASKDLITLLRELKNEDMKEQGIFFNKLISNEAIDNKKLDDIFLIGVRV